MIGRQMIRLRISDNQRLYIDKGSYDEISKMIDISDEDFKVFLSSVHRISKNSFSALKFKHEKTSKEYVFDNVYVWIESIY
jgi:hypothetical protein